MAEEEKAENVTTQGEPFSSTIGILVRTVRSTRQTCPDAHDCLKAVIARAIWRFYAIGNKWKACYPRWFITNRLYHAAREEFEALERTSGEVTDCHRELSWMMERCDKLWLEYKAEAEQRRRNSDIYYIVDRIFSEVLDMATTPDPNRWGFFRWRITIAVIADIEISCGDTKNADFPDSLVTKKLQKAASYMYNLDGLGKFHGGRWLLLERLMEIQQRCGELCEIQQFIERGLKVWEKSQLPG
ncbi:hypothetical protein B0T21DRAFT_406259 [Apiosordaria backusii]|uniref:Uncharacterized protein n=1 Tax=Apiosordaria backusii TaxID=314023 RepID=A0AA40EY25_9PEZI|nr:hypothetical protein B0T21DRAFT_406259 [Apiosordaria backusii]